MSLHTFSRILLCLVACLLPAAGVLSAPSITVEAPDVIGNDAQSAVVPLIPMIELLGARLEQHADGNLTVIMGKRTFSCTLEGFQAQVNGKACTLPMAPFVVDDVVYVPLQPLVAAVGGKCKFDAKKSGVQIRMPGRAHPIKLMLMKGEKTNNETGEKAAMSSKELAEMISGKAPVLYLINPDGSGLRRITYNVLGGGMPTISADGSKWLITHIGNPIFGAGIFTRSPNDPMYTCLLEEPVMSDNTVDSPLLFGNAEISPDGTKIVYVAMGANIKAGTIFSALYVMPYRKGKPVRLANGGTPCWSPDGNTIAFTIPKDDTTMLLDGTMEEAGTVAIINPDGSAIRSIGEGFMPQFSPDGKRLLFYRKYARRGPLITVCQFGEKPGEFTITEAADDVHLIEERDAVFTPDGRILHVCAGFGIFLMNADRSEGKQLTADREDRAPICSPDGKQVYFIREGTIFRMNIDGSALTPLAKDVSAYQLKFLPDGSQLLFITEADDSFM